MIVGNLLIKKIEGRHNYVDVVVSTNPVRYGHKELKTPMLYLGNGEIVINQNDIGIYQKTKLKIDFNDLAKAIAKKEGKKKQLSIAQIKEVMKLMKEELSKNDNDAVLRFIYQ